MAQIKNLKPWEYLHNNIPVIIKDFFPNDVFITVMGNGGEVTGLIIYQNNREFFKAYCQYNLRASDKIEAFIFNHESIAVLWGDKDSVSDANRKLIKELGLRFRGNNWQYIEKYGNYRLYESLTAEDAENTRNILEIFLKAAMMIHKNSDCLYPDDSAVLAEKDDKGSVSIRPIILDHDKNLDCLLVPLNVNKNIRDIKKIKTKKYSAELNIFYSDFPMDDGNGNMLFPGFAVIADSKSGKELISDVNDDPIIPEDSFLFDSVANLCEEYGKPEKITVCDKYIEMTLREFCKMTGITLEYSEYPLDNASKCFDQKVGMINKFSEAALRKFGSGKEPLEEDLMNMILDVLEEEVRKSGKPQITMSSKKTSSSKKPVKKPSAKKSGKKKKYADMSIKLSVSLDKGLYKHFLIPAGISFGELHTIILDAFGFDDDHMHEFFLDNRPYSEKGQLTKGFEQNDSSYNYILGDYLSEGMKFLFLFDFGDDWCFYCKVLGISDTPCKTAAVVKSVGKNPVQYPDYDEDEE